MQAHELPLEKLNLPPGFEISIYAEVINPRQLARSPSGVVYSGSRRAGNLYALVDADGDQQAEQVITLDTKLSAALTSIITGELSRQLRLVKEKYHWRASESKDDKYFIFFLIII